MKNSNHWFQKDEMLGIEHRRGDAWSSKGFAVIIKTNIYKEFGGENEGYISWGMEDCERYQRFLKLKRKIGYVNGCVIHLEHHRNMNSNKNNPFFKKNKIQYEQLLKMDHAQVIDYCQNLVFKFNNISSTAAEHPEVCDSE